MENKGFTALNKAICSHNISQFLLYNDDSLDIYFTDGGQLELSPCGANYKFKCNTKSKSESSHARKSQQRCKFATSSTKPRVEAALEIRNLIASRPYIPERFISIYQDRGDVDHRDINEFQWNNAQDWKHNDAAKLPYAAKDDLAYFSLDECIGTVKFMSKLSRNDRPNSEKDYKDSKASSENDEDVAVYTKKQRIRREYVWMTNIFPVEIPPFAWRNLVNKPSSSFTTSSPAPLPEVCPNQFKHQWREGNSNTQEPDGIVNPGKRLKLYYHNETAYWFYPSNDKQQQNGFRIVVWLQDGSTLRTHPTNLFYLAHRQYGLKATDRIYSPTHLPQDTYLKGVILCATRLLSACLHSSDDTVQTNQCWEEQRVQPQLGNKCGDIFETAVIAGLGRFSVADGSVQIRYDSGVTLHSSINDALLQQLVALGSSALCSTSCRLFYPDGQYSVCNSLTDHSYGISNYIQPLCDWIMWLSQSKEQRVAHPFYSDSLYAEGNRNKVQDELEKINRFNVLLESSQLKDLVEVSGNSSTHELPMTNCESSKEESSSNVGGKTKQDQKIDNKENFYMELSSGGGRKEFGTTTAAVKKDVTADDVLVTLTQNTRTLNDIDQFLRNITLNK